MVKRIFLNILLYSLPLAMQAQTVVWKMRPADYNEIERINANLLLVSRNGKIGLANTDGSIVASLVNEGITDYYEHKAILTYNDGHGERVTGCLTDDGKYYGYAKKFYALNGQKFFSDGLLSVADERGNLGYIDITGNQVVGFDGKYNRIKPFSEGYAAVMKGKRYILIDKYGDVVRFTYGGTGVGAAIGGCTNVYDGKCYVYDEYGGSDRSFFIYDTKERGTLKKTSRVKNTAMDYLFCYQSVSGRSKVIPYEQRRPYTGVQGLNSVSANGLYGYQKGMKTILPYQLTGATAFTDGEAIVEISGLKGILKYVDGESFSVSVSKDSYSFYAGNNVTASFSVNIPTVWRNKQVSVKVKDERGIEQRVSSKDNNYSFVISPSSSSRRDFLVAIYGESLKLYEGVLSYTFVKKERCQVCGKDKDQCEYKGSHPSPSSVSSRKKPHHESKTEKICETCGKKISECKYQGVH